MGKHVRDSSKPEKVAAASKDLPRKTPGVPISKVWPEALEVSEKIRKAVERSSKDKRRFGQCKPAY